MRDTYQFTDHARLIADLEADDQSAVTWAYARLFDGPMGKLVLTHQLALAGVGSPRGPDMDAHARAYHDGGADHALRLLHLAGFGRMSAAHAVAADVLEGQNHDRHDPDPGRDARFSGPDGPDPAGQDGPGPD